MASSDLTCSLYTLAFLWKLNILNSSVSLTLHAVAIIWQYHFYDEGVNWHDNTKGCFQVFINRLQLIKDPIPQTINQSKQHNLNQKRRPKSTNKQLISQKWNRSLPKIKIEIRKSTQGQSASDLWLGFEEKKVIYDF